MIHHIGMTLRQSTSEERDQDMNTTSTNERRHSMLRVIGVGATLLAVLAATGCSPSNSGPEGGTRSTTSTPAAADLASGDTSKGADNFYTSDRVDVQKVSFKNQYQMNVVGNLYVPKGLSPNSKAAALVVGHPMGAVKEQSANLYAKMAEQGFVTLSFDQSFWGESD